MRWWEWRPWRRRRTRLDGEVIATFIRGDGERIQGRAEVTVILFRVEITEPNEDPVTDNNFTFNPANPGVCNVIATGTTGITEEDRNLRWRLTPITGSTLTRDPPRGARITFTYRGLPHSNDQFGKKTLTLIHPELGEAHKDTQIVEIFFPRDETNNPGRRWRRETWWRFWEWGERDPNWYFYWSQTSASIGPHRFDPTPPFPYPVYGYYRLGARYFYIGPLAGTNIDKFAKTCIHEKVHLTDWWNFWPNGRDLAQDTDRDHIPDYRERALGFNPNMRDTHPNDSWRFDFVRFSELRAYAAEAGWATGSADGEDWSDPGRQSSR